LSFGRGVRVRTLTGPYMVPTLRKHIDVITEW
jgi:hypothetical protein